MNEQQITEDYNFFYFRSNKYTAYNGVDVKDISPVKEKQSVLPPSTKV